MAKKLPEAKTEEPKVTATNMIRWMLLHNPEVSLEAVQQEWEQREFAGDKPTSQKVYLARAELKKKYGAGIELLSLRGKPNVSSMIRLLLKKRPDLTNAQCHKLLATDGLTYTPALFGQVQRTHSSQTESVVNAASLISPDPNQDSGPRRRKKSKLGRPPGSVSKVKRSKNGDKQVEMMECLLGLESHYDSLLTLGSEFFDAKLIEQLKRARRKIGTVIDEREALLNKS